VFRAQRERADDIILGPRPTRRVGQKGRRQRNHDQGSRLNCSGAKNLKSTHIHVKTVKGVVRADGPRCRRAADKSTATEVVFRCIGAVGVGKEPSLKSPPSSGNSCAGPAGLIVSAGWPGVSKDPRRGRELPGGSASAARGGSGPLEAWRVRRLKREASRSLRGNGPGYGALRKA